MPPVEDNNLNHRGNRKGIGVNLSPAGYWWKALNISSLLREKLKTDEEMRRWGDKEMRGKRSKDFSFLSSSPHLLISSSPQLRVSDNCTRGLKLTTMRLRRPCRRLNFKSVIYLPVVKTHHQWGYNYPINRLTNLKGNKNKMGCLGCFLSAWLGGSLNRKLPDFSPIWLVI